MANGPDRSNWLNSPSAWARRSATAHKTAGFTPSPTWPARYTSMFSEAAEGRARQVRQFTTPSVREWIDVVGTGRSHQQRRKHQTGVELEYPSDLGQQQTKSRRTKRTCRWRFALIGPRHYFLSLARVPPRPAIVTNMS